MKAQEPLFLCNNFPREHYFEEIWETGDMERETGQKNVIETANIL